MCDDHRGERGGVRERSGYRCEGRGGSGGVEHRGVRGGCHGELSEGGYYCGHWEGRGVEDAEGAGGECSEGGERGESAWRDWREEHMPRWRERGRLWRRRWSR